MRLADYVADFLVAHGVTHCFSVVGGGAMYLNDSLGHKDGLKVVYQHHEQACAIAAEAYARLENRIAALCVTTGPGGTNALTGVLGGWLDSILPEERAMVNEYLGVMTDDPAEAVDKMVRAALSCVADTCIIPLQDYLGLDNSARINQPSTFGKNWKWRLDPETIDDALAQRIRSLCSLYGRNTGV